MKTKIIDYVIQIPDTDIAKQYADETAEKLRDAQDRGDKAAEAAEQRESDHIALREGKKPTVEAESTVVVNEETDHGSEEAGTEEKAISEKPKRKPGPKAKAQG